MLAEELEPLWFTAHLLRVPEIFGCYISLTKQKDDTPRAQSAPKNRAPLPVYILHARHAQRAAPRPRRARRPRPRPRRPIRALHNRLKRKLIFRHLPLGARVLDLGAGRCGDLLKYRAARVRALVDCESDTEAFTELLSRAANVFPATALISGDILQLPLLPTLQHFDGVTSFFALQYLFSDEVYVLVCIKHISHLIHPGGKLFGVVPDTSRVLLRTCSDIRVPTNAGARDARFGESIWVFLPKPLYYSAVTVTEALCY